MTSVPFETTHYIRDHCLCLETQRAARRLARRFDDALRPFGLTHGQFSLLNGLNRPAPPLMRDVARLLAVDRTTLTAALKPLERRGFVQVTPDAQDRRGRRVALTPAGRAALAGAVPTWRAVHGEIEAGLPEGGPAALRLGLAALAS